MSSPRPILLVAHPADAERRVRSALGTSASILLTLPSVGEAIAALTEVRPLLILLWPASFTPELRQSWRTLKVFAQETRTAVIAVGPSDLAGVDEALACGVDEYLPESTLGAALPSRIQALSQPALPGRQPPFRPRTVLLADPDALWRMQMGGLLEAAGHHVLYAGHTLELLEALQGFRGPLPEICIVDPFGPELGGLDALRALRAQPSGRRLPVLLVSAAPREPALLEELRSLDVHDLLDKSRAAFDAVVPIIQDYVSLAVRRRAPRLSFLELCRFRAAPDATPEDRWDAGLIYNLSGTGAFIRTLAPLAEAVGLDVELTLGPRGAARLRARVAWTHPFQVERPGRPPGMGVYFDPLTDELRLRLESCLWARPEPGSDPVRAPLEAEPPPRV